MNSMNFVGELKPVLSVVFADSDPTASRIAAARQVFGFLPEVELHRLVRAAEVRSFRHKQVILRDGDPGVSLIVVLEGFVKLSTVDQDGRETLLDIVGPGDCIGELAILNDWQHSADATALSPCRVLSIDVRQFRQMLERNPACLLEIVRMVGDRLHRTTERLVDALGLPAPAHLAKAILRLADLRHQNGNGQTAPKLRQSELAAMTGLCRESVNKLLAAWSEAGWIQMVGGSVELAEPSALRRLIGEGQFMPGRMPERASAAR